jgi:hypothetical protein
MDLGTIVVIILLIAAMLIIASVVVFLLGKVRADAASAYEKRVKIEMEYDRALIGAAKVMVVGKFAYITEGVKGDQIQYRTVALDDSGTPITAQEIDGKKLEAHQIAARLVSDSISRRGGDGVQLLTAAEWEALGHDRISHGVALDHLRQFNIKINQGGKMQGTFVPDGKTLQMLMLDVAINALPMATGNRVEKS